jgi:predicted cupin superfamily sugar epimerase
MNYSAAQITDLFGLQPHPTCGFVHESYHSPLAVPASALPPGYGGPRPLGGALCFLVTPQAPVRLHRIRSDQMYHHYLGAPLEVLLLYPDGRGEVRVVGPDLGAGMRPFLLVPGGAFHAARVARGGDWSLLGTSVWVRPEPSDVEMGDPERLAAAYPALRDEVRAFAGR